MMHSFVLEVDGVRVATLLEVTGLSTETDVIEVKQQGADGTFVVKKLPGRPKASELTITRGLSEDRTFEQWMADVAHGGAAPRRDVSITVVDYEGQPEVRFVLAGAWPRRLEYDNFRADATESPVERLILVHEGLERA